MRKTVKIQFAQVCVGCAWSVLDDEKDMLWCVPYKKEVEDEGGCKDWELDLANIGLEQLDPRIVR